MTIQIELSSETEARLREQARASGKEVERFVRDAVEEKLASSAMGETPASPPAASGPRIQMLQEWIASHSVRTGVQLDDSRESIYAGRGE